MSDIYKERIFELISKEEVVLFAGAGLSLYAGYPSGNGLRKIFYDTLNQKEKEIINEHQQLSTLTQNLFDLHNSRNSTISILRDVFLAKPKSNEIHRRISEIPHFKTIITTNYDNLIEDTCNKYNKVVDDKYCVKQLFQNKPKSDLILYKMHGDIDFPADAILTK